MSRYLPQGNGRITSDCNAIARLAHRGPGASNSAIDSSEHLNERSLARVLLARPASPRQLEDSRFHRLVSRNTAPVVVDSINAPTAPQANTRTLQWLTI